MGADEQVRQFLGDALRATEMAARNKARLKAWKLRYACRLAEAVRRVAEGCASDEDVRICMRVMEVRRGTV